MSGAREQAELLWSGSMHPARLPRTGACEGQDRRGRLGPKHAAPAFLHLRAAHELCSVVRYGMQVRLVGAAGVLPAAGGREGGAVRDGHPSAQRDGQSAPGTRSHQCHPGAPMPPKYGSTCGGLRFMAASGDQDVAAISSATAGELLDLHQALLHGALCQAHREVRFLGSDLGARLLCRTRW